MQTTDVLSILESEKDDRGIRHWKALGTKTGGLESFGIGLTRLRKLAKRIGRDRALARDLWRTNVYDAHVVSLLIDDPKAITRDQVEAQVEELTAGLAHVFSSCDATLAKTDFVVELADEWIRTGNAIRRSCGYGLLYEISKFAGRKAPPTEFFLDHVQLIDDTIDQEKSGVRLAMGTALMGIGKRDRRLNEAALAVAERVGPIEFESSGEKCDPFDVAKHLKTDRLKEKLGA
ncbi:MAG: DNA alkylation repair protein [Gemmatimonadota bacterium]